LGRYGAKVGAFLAAETGAEPGSTLAKVLQRSEDGFVGVAFNPGRLIINRHSVRDSLLALRDRVGVVCAVDGVLDLAAGRGIAVPLGRGTADFPELIGILEENQYRGSFIVGRQDGSAREVQQGIDYLRNL